MRRAKIGHHHRISDKYLCSHARHAAFRDDRRRNSSGEQFKAIVTLVVANPECGLLRLMAGESAGRLTGTVKPWA